MGAWPELRRAGAELVGDVAPGLDGGRPVGLVEGLPDRGGNDGVLALGHMGERVSDPVNAASLPGRLEHPRDGGLEASKGRKHKPMISRRPPESTAIAIIAATETILPPWRPLR
jgi:hypothetical protein